MGTIWVREFTGGLDARKLPESSPGGTLIRARDCHINRGGAIEQRAVFEEVYTLPAGETTGLAATPDGLYVFGHQPTSAVPTGVTYQRLPHPTAQSLETVTHTTLYRGKIAVAAEFADGSHYAFYDGTRITDANAPPNLANSGDPVVLLTAEQKLHIAAGPNLFFSAVTDPMDFGAGAGAGDGFIAMSTHADGAEQLTALARYDQFLAVFSRRVIQIWYLDPDPDLLRQSQVLNNTGSISARSVTQFGDGDVFYLDRSGIRSLRARDSSNSAATTDIGSAIDPLLGPIISDNIAQAERAIGLIEPRDGRFWMAVGDTIYVFSYFSSSRVSAWSEYKPGFTVDDMVVWNDRVWLRSGDTIYVYGGTGDEYAYSADVEAEAWMPYLDADQPFREKHVKGVDAALRGTWEIWLALDPNNHAASDLVTRLDRTTFGLGMIPAEGQGNHISLRFKALAPASATEPAVLSSVVLHHDKDDKEDS